MADFFTGNWSLNHKNIIQYSQRPFKTTDDMNDCIIENTNKLVGENDRLIFAGDFLFGPLDFDKFLRTARFFRRRINCRNIFLIYGNHDRRALREESFNRMFVRTCDYLELKSHNDQSIILFHYPIESFCWNRVNAGAWHLYAHTNKEIIDTPETPRLNISVDSVARYLHPDRSAEPADYRPFTFDELHSILNPRVQTFLSLQQQKAPKELFAEV